MSSVESDLAETSESTQRQWLYKYSDDLANIFGGLLVLAVGCTLFAIVAVASEGKNPEPIYFWSLIITSVLIAMASFPLIIHFSRKVPVVERISEESRHRNATYIISEWRIKTLKAAGVPDDVIEYLESLLGKSNTIPKELKTTIPADSPNNWLTKLKNELGETRVGEFEDIILKYTRHQKVKRIEKNLAE